LNEPLKALNAPLKLFNGSFEAPGDTIKLLPEPGVSLSR
jgi:hypothetical protein